jgi:hypothetical protein
MPWFQHDPHYLLFGQEGAAAPTSRLSPIAKVVAAPIDKVVVPNCITKDVIAPNCIVVPSLATTQGTTIQPPLPFLLPLLIPAFYCCCNNDIKLIPPSSMILNSCVVCMKKKGGV